VARDTSFSYSFLVLPAAQRDAIGLVWDFCRAVDDAVDEASDQQTAAIAIVKWRDEVGRVFGAAEPVTPQGRPLKPVAAAFSLSRQPFDDLVDGVEMDLHHTRYQTFDELAGYCRRVASTVGLMCVEIFGARDPRSRDYAFNLGLALQLTKFGVTEADLRAGTVTPEIRRLLAYQVQRTRRFYAAAALSKPAAAARQLVAAEIMGGIYFETLRRIERRQFDVFTEVIRAPKAVRARIALSIWARSQCSALASRLFRRT